MDCCHTAAGHEEGTDDPCIWGVEGGSNKSTGPEVGGAHMAECPAKLRRELLRTASFQSTHPWTCERL